METMTNALGQRVPAHWNCGVWISYAAFQNLLMSLQIDPSLTPSVSEYQQAMKVEVMEYLLSLNIGGLMESPERTTRALQVLLNKLNEDLV